MVFFRRIYRLSALLLWAILVALLSMPHRLRGGWKSVKEISYFTRLWSRGIAKIINLHVKVSGPIPSSAGGLVISNHLSYIDIITHGSILPVRYSPKSDIKKWPVLGWYLGLSRPIWTNRNSRQASKKILRDFTKTVNKGMYLIVDPEGTSTDGNSGILPFKSTSFEAAITGKTPIIPVLTRYKQRRGEMTVCWYGEMTLLPHLWKVLGFPSIEAEVHFLKPILPEGRSRKDLALFVHDTMEREYKKL
jgi:1-acyl-sn-glycerol-3-phosphate acyltransferase